MKLGSIPHIYNIDKIKVYRYNKLLQEVWVGHHALGWHIKEDEVLREYTGNVVEEMSIIIEGCLSEIIVLEIFLK